MEGKVFRLQIAQASGAPMTSIAEAHLVPGKGIVGDTVQVIAEVTAKSEHDEVGR